jgi:hypothetical protein
MIERYSRPEMAALWTMEARFGAWLEVELAVCEAWASLGVIPQADMESIRSKASFDVRILEIEKTTIDHRVLTAVEKWRKRPFTTCSHSTWNATRALVRRESSGHSTRCWLRKRCVEHKTACRAHPRHPPEPTTSPQMRILRESSH